MVDKISKIYYINLEHREDRKAQIESELIKMDLLHKTERFNAIYNKDHPALGCCYSHLTCLENAKNNNFDNILIFEDDFEFIVDKKYFNDKLNILMNDNTWDILFLSYNCKEYIPIDENKIKLIYSQTASGYIVNNKHFDTLINLYKYNFEQLKNTYKHWLYMNDVCWMSLMKTHNYYGIINKIGKQRAGYSDLAGTYMDYNT